MPDYYYQISGLDFKLRSAIDKVLSRIKPSPLAWEIEERKFPFPFSIPNPSKRSYLRKRPDGSLVLTWPWRGTFWIQPARRRVEYRPHSKTTFDLFLDVFLGRVVSFLLILEGNHPLHGSAVEIRKKAVCFMGSPGAGKSSLAASFLLSGYRLIADDLLRLDRLETKPRLYPGYPEIRLWPGSGKKIFPSFSRLPQVIHTASKMRVDARKIGKGFAARPVAMGMIYEIKRRKISRPAAAEIPKKEKLPILFSNLYNTALKTPALVRAQFEVLGGLADKIPMRRLYLPRSIKNPFSILKFVLQDLRRQGL